MLNPIAANAIRWREHREEMSIQLLGPAAGPAQAEQGYLSFQVHPPVGSLAVFWREHLHQVIIDRLVGARGLGEAARAPLGGHVVTPFSCVSSSAKRDCGARPGGKEPRAEWLRGPGRAGLA